MEKRLLLGISIVLIMALIGGGVYMAFFRKPKTVETVRNFKLTDYSYFIENFPSEKVLGSIDSAEAAKEKAEIIWLEIYGESIKERSPYVVSFDDENQVWLVHGILPKYWVGGVPQILIQKSDGKVLAVWHDK